MAQRLNNIVGNSSPYIGNPYGQPIQLCRPIKQDMGPRSVRVDIDWSTYGGGTANPNLSVLVSLDNQQVQNPLDAIRSIYIDNTFSVVPVYVVFPDTLYNVVAPPGAVVMSPVFTNVRQALVYVEGLANGAVPLTSVHFSNIDRQGYYIPTTQSGEILNPLNALLLASQQSSNVTGNNPIVFSNMDIGAADPTKLLCVCFNAIDVNGTATPITVNAVTVGGVAIATHVQNTVLATTSADRTLSYIGGGIVALGGLQTISFTMSSNLMQFAMCSVYQITNYTQILPFDIDDTSSNALIPNLSIGLQGIPGAVAIGSSIFSSNAAQPIPNWTGFTRDTAYDLLFDGSSWGTTAYYNYLASGLHQGLVPANNLVGVSYI